MKEAHEKLKINDTHFNVIKSTLCTTLVEMGVNHIYIKEVSQLLETLREPIVSVKISLYERL
jgi:hypothetical protein